MSVPDWWEVLLLSLAAYRVFRLIAEDDILEGPRRRLLRMAADWEEGQDLPEEYRDKLALFIDCPACCGFWISVAWFGVWQIFPHETLVFAAVWAISAIVIFLRINLDPPE